MTIEEELVYLRVENKVLREQLAQRDEIIQQQQEFLSEQNAVILQHGEQMSSLSEQVKSLRERLSKDSHLPPMRTIRVLSNRFNDYRKLLSCPGYFTHPRSLADGYGK